MTKIRMTITTVVEYPLKREYYDNCATELDCVALDEENARLQPIEFLTMGDFNHEIDTEVTVKGELVP